MELSAKFAIKEVTLQIIVIKILSASTATRKDTLPANVFKILNHLNLGVGKNDRKTERPEGTDPDRPVRKPNYLIFLTSSLNSLALCDSASHRVTIGLPQSSPLRLCLSALTSHNRSLASLSQPPKYTRVVLIGDSGVGKSNLLSSLQGQIWWFVVACGFVEFEDYIFLYLIQKLGKMNLTNAAK
ncbi:uncharacterized protein LOC112178854 [Rosa chinensis]|uniref:uncharacterized protein LOC112178854 n=1 Tax=Rosa chinensis TaxID=74649 RepID=UPI001AD8DE7B|nr:uncharacterized protein LOC112178854 [Rosa chinensis]